MRAGLDNLRQLGVEPEDTFGQRLSASTDVGNVSHACPTAAPGIFIAPSSVPGHSREFAAAAASEAGHRGLLLAAKMLAMTALDVIMRPSLAWEMEADFAAEGPPGTL
jgi:metal-dependent amidase/aminoacylase/carboxypeptidase family protein